MLTSDPPAALRQTAGAATWHRVTHRAGWILKAKQTNPSGLPPYDPDAKWTEAAREWSRYKDEDDSPLPRESRRAFDDDGAPLRKAEPDELLLGAIRAKLVAQNVMDNHARYNKFVRDTLHAFGGFDVKIRAEQPAVRFDPGLIVDLPSFTVYMENKEVASGRLCMTVCMNESRSKIWSRITSMDDAFWGAEPKTQTEALITQSRKWFEQYADHIRALYEKHIADALRASHEPHPRVDLTVQSRIDLVSGDVSMPGLAGLTNAIAGRNPDFDNPAARAAARQVDLMVHSVPNMDVAADGSAVDAILRSDTTKLGKGRYYLVPDLTPLGFRGMYVVRAWEDNLLFAGIATEDSNPAVTVVALDEKHPAVNSPSQHVTAELANTVAKYF
jgi:hypothetical protein